VTDVDNTAFVVVGEENGQDFVRQLENDGIKASILTVRGRIRENITLHTEGKDETRISFSGFYATEELLSFVESELEKIVDAETVLTFTGRIPDGLEVTAVKRLLKKLVDNGARIVVDSRSFDRTDILELCPYLIKPNEEEVSLYADTQVTDLESAVRAASKLRECGIKNVMISLGSRGAVLCCEDGNYVASAPRIDAISTIGAGDSSIAGFLAAAKQGRTYADMLRTAVAYGSAACLTEGTKPPRKEDVASLYEKITVKKM
jgi:1-phosphofructokinase family hexose kinase